MKMQEKMNEMAEAEILKPDNSIGYCIECYKDGFTAALSLEEVKGLVVALNQIATYGQGLDKDIANDALIEWFKFTGDQNGK